MGVRVPANSNVGCSGFRYKSTWAPSLKSFDTSWVANHFPFGQCQKIRVKFIPVDVLGNVTSRVDRDCVFNWTTAIKNAYLKFAHGIGKHKYIENAKGRSVLTLLTDNYRNDVWFEISYSSSFMSFLDPCMKTASIDSSTVGKMFQYTVELGDFDEFHGMVGRLASKKMPPSSCMMRLPTNQALRLDESVYFTSVRS